MMSQPGSMLSRTVDRFTRSGCVQLVHESAEQVRCCEIFCDQYPIIYNY